MVIQTMADAGPYGDATDVNLWGLPRPWPSHAHALYGAGLGGIVEDALAQAKAFIQSQAKAGAESATPGIEADVRQTVRDTIKPWMIGAYALGGVGFVTAVTALIVAIKRR